MMTMTMQRPTAVVRSLLALAGAVLLGVGLGAPELAAQEAGRFAVEVRGGGTLGYIDVSGASLSPDPSFGWAVAASYRMMPALSVGLGYDRAPFGCDPEVGFCAVYEPTFTSSGLSLDGRAQWPRGLIRPWVGAGVGYRTLSTRVTGIGEQPELESDGAMALSASAGIDVRVTPRLFVGPSARYIAHESAREGASAEQVRIVGADFGVRLVF